MRIQIVNGSVVFPDGIRKVPVNLSDGKIEGFREDFAAERTIDAEGCYVSPGFIDIHTHGGDLCDFMDGTEEAYLRAARAHAVHGTTTLLPTLLSASREEMVRSLEAYEKVKKTTHDGASMPGVHLEGPYFSVKQCGAQDPKYIRDPDPDEYLPLLDRFPSILRWSAAPEREGAIRFGRELTARGVLPSVAHTDASCAQVYDAYEAGFTHMTHLYSSMSTIHRVNAFRVAGALEAAYLIDGMTVEIIADGCHLPSELLRFVTKFKKPQQIALITDSSRGAGSDATSFRLGSRENGLDVIVEDGVAKLPDRSAFAGSIATFDRLIRTMMKLTDCSLPEIVTMASASPARICGLKGKGELIPGYDADVVIFDPDVRIRKTVVGGRIVYEG